MNLTRKEALTGIAGILAAGTAPAAVVRSMLGARGVATAGGGGLPYDEKLVYVVGGRYQYVDLDYFNGNKLSITMKLTTVADDREEDIVSNQDNSTNRFVVGFYNKYMFAYSRQNQTQNINAVTSTFYPNLVKTISIEYDSIFGTKKVECDGITDTKSCGAINNTNKKIRLFNNQVAENYYYDQPLYMISMSFNEIPTYRLIPVLKDNIPYLYNEIDGRFFGCVEHGRKLGYKRYNGQIVNPS